MYLDRNLVSEGRAAQPSFKLSFLSVSSMHISTSILQSTSVYRVQVFCMSRIVPLDSADIEQLEKSMDKVLPKIVDTLSQRESPSVMKEDDWIRLMAAFPIFAMTTDIASLKEDLVERNSIAETWAAARDRMKEIPVPIGFEPLSARVVEKRGTCSVYSVGDSFKIPSPFYWPKPCPALWFSAWPYLIAAGFGFEGWESDNPHVYRISCPSKKGIVLEMIKTKLLQ